MSASSSSSGFTREEALALVIALAAHAGLIAALTLSPPGKSIMSPPERLTVTFADETAETSTSPNPNEEAAPETAPVLGEPAPEPAPPQPVPQIAQPQPKPVPPPPPPQAKPAPQPKPAPRPAPAAQPRVPPAPPPKPAAKPAAASPAPDNRQRRRPDAPSGASQIGADFLSGIPTGTRPGTKGNPADAVSAEAKAAIRVTINRKVVPPWNSCPLSGVEIEKLRAKVTFQLDRAGNITSIASPVLSGQTPANSPQVGRFTECAVRAIRTAAPFNLPPESYDFWKTYTLNFRKE